MTTHNLQNSQSREATEQFIHQVAQDAIRMMANQLLSRLMSSANRANSHFSNTLESQKTSTRLFEGLFKKATGQVLSVVLQETTATGQEQSQEIINLRRDFEQVMKNALIQELSNAAKNMEMSLWKAFGVSRDEVLGKLKGHYSSSTGLSHQVETVINEFLSDTDNIGSNHNSHNNEEQNYNARANLNSNPNFNVRQHLLKIQLFLHSSLDGVMQSTMRQAYRNVVEHSLGQWVEPSNPNLVSFVNYTKLQQERALAGNKPVVQAELTAGQKERLARFSLVV